MSHFVKHNAGSWFIIANPTSGNRNFSKQWKEIQQSDGKIYRERTCYQQ